MTQTLNELFTEKQIETIEKCVSAGMFSDIPSALESVGVFEMTPARGKAIESFLQGKRPVEVFESKVKQEFEQWELKGNRIETQEQEKEWQDKFDAEREEAKKSIVKDAAALSKREDKPTNEDMGEFEMTKQEVMDALRSKNIPFNPQQKKAELSALLEMQLV